MTRYWTFISYSHHDRRVARWLTDELRRIRVPKSLRSITSPPVTYVTNVFRDEVSASASSSLSEELRAALRASHSLLVVCSPLAAASPHVCEEIRYFQSLGRADRIFCVVVAGVPNAADRGEPVLECFPEPLRVCTTEHGAQSIPIPDRPLGVPVGDESPRERAFVARRVAAGLMGITLEDLARARRNTALLQVAGLVAIAVLLGATWVLLRYPFVTYSREFAYVYGAPEPQLEVSASIARQLPEVFRIERRGFFGRPSRISFVNGYGSCPKHGMPNVIDHYLDDQCGAARACAVEIAYDSAGSVAELRYLSSYGRVLERLQYTEPAVALFTEAGFGCSRSKSGIRYVTFERYADGPHAGRDRVVRYYGENAAGEREPRNNDHGAYGRLYEYDERGLIRSTTMLGPDGQPRANSYGYVTERLTRDERGRILLREWLDASGQRTLTSEGYAAVRNEYDALGRKIAAHFFDAADQPTLDSEGKAGARLTLGARGEALRSESLDLRGSPTPVAGGTVALARTYDSRGYESSITSLDATGHPIDLADCASYAYLNGEHGEILTVRFLNADESPCYQNGFAEARYTYDERGNRIVQERFLAGGIPTLPTDGDICHREIRRYNEANQHISGHCFGADLKPYPGVAGASDVQIRYDANGNAIEQAHFGIDGRPAPDEDGVALRRYKYDDQGRRIWLGKFDVTGEPHTGSGWHAIATRYDDFGRVAEVTALDVNGQPTRSAPGQTSTVHRYDAFGREIRREYLDAAGKLMVNESGTAGREQLYDRHGNVIVERYFDANGRPTRNRSGVAEIRWTFDERGRELTRRYFDTLGQLTRTNDGIAGWNSRSDERGRIIEGRFIGPDDAPTADDVGRHGWRKDYDSRGNVTLEIDIDANGNPWVDPQTGVSGWRIVRDQAGHQIEMIYVDGELKPTIERQLRTSRIRTTYDNFNRIASQTYLSPEGVPMMTHDGYAKLVYTYNAQGKHAVWEYFDTAGAPTTGRPARVEYEYDVFGREVRRSFFDAKGVLTPHPNSGRAISETSYDSSGRVLRIVSLGTDRKLVNRKDQGWATKIFSYSSKGEQTSRRCVRADGTEVQPCGEED